MLEEQLVDLPELIVPLRHRSSQARPLDGSSVFLIQTSPGGHPTVYPEIGSPFNLKKPSDLLRLFPSKFNWSASRHCEFDSLLRVFNPDQLEDLVRLNYFEFSLGISTYQVYWVPGTAKIRITSDNNSRTSRFLFNIAAFVSKRYPLDTLENIKSAVDKVVQLNKTISINPMSAASTVKDLLLDELGPQFTISNKLTQDDFRFLHTAYKGGRMETRFLGTLNNVGNLDQKKAYLRALAEQPSLDGNIWKIYRGDTLIEEDVHPGSVYKIEVQVPRQYAHFAPIPVRSEPCKVSYPSGNFICHVARPYIDILRDLKDIPFRVIDSIQFVLTDPGLYPFRDICTFIEMFEDRFKEDLYPLDLKRLHTTIVGHFLSYHKELDRWTGEITYHTAEDYNPVLACGVQALVSCDMWKLSAVTDSMAIRMDAITGRDLPKDNSRYKGPDSGLMTFLSPNLKDKPGSTLYRDLIESSRDRPAIKVHGVRQVSVVQSYDRPSRLGRSVEVSADIFPTSGSRILSEEVNRVGKLLDSSIPTIIPSADSLLEKASDDWHRKNRMVTWLYRHLECLDTVPAD